MDAVGYGALMLGLWAAFFAYLLIVRTGWMFEHRRQVLSSAAIVLGCLTILGIFDPPAAPATSLTTASGDLGNLLARAPFAWQSDGTAATVWQVVLAWLRAAALITIGCTFQFPDAIASMLRSLRRRAP